MVASSGPLSKHYIVKAGFGAHFAQDPEATMAAVSGKNIVPTYVSLLNLGGFGLILAGVGLLAWGWLA